MSDINVLAPGNTAPVAVQPTYISDLLLGLVLEGSRKGRWKVIKAMGPSKDPSRGNFSHGYIVKNEKDGTEAFMKAFDTKFITRDQQGFDATKNLTIALALYNFEKDILDYCQGSKLSKIVRIVDCNHVFLPHEGTNEMVFFLIFELAQSDARAWVNKETQTDMAWRLYSIKDIAIAIKQLHQIKVAHNDIKPSNVLRFTQDNHKLADLGRAINASVPGPVDQHDCPGQLSYGAPEQLYRYYDTGKSGISFESRRASDLYSYGSMIYFFMTNTMLTPTVNSLLQKEHRTTEFGGTFEEVLPYWREAYGQALQVLKECLPKNDKGALSELGNEIFQIVTQLCDPEPSLRGHPTNRAGGAGNQYSLEKYISRIDVLVHKFSIGRIK